MTALWAIITGNPIVRALGVAIMAVLGVLTFGKVKHREGVKEERSRREAADAKETIQAHEDRQDVEDRIATDDNARDSLRSKWRE
jgi:uncharacterized protein YlxW (UPF0749 family)